jgi:hypothetical protein
MGFACGKSLPYVKTKYGDKIAMAGANIIWKANDQ